MHQLSTPTCAHHLFYPGTFGLQRTGTYDYTHPLHGVTAKTMNRNCLPWGRIPKKCTTLAVMRKCFEREDKGNQQINFSGII